MLTLVVFAGIFLTLSGLAFITAPLLPPTGALASARRLFELSGPFETGTCVISGGLFLISGAGLLAWSAGIV